MNRCLGYNLRVFALACTMFAGLPYVLASEEVKPETLVDDEISLRSPSGMGRESIRLKDLTEIKLLARGTFGEVHLVKDRADNVYALKIVSKAFLEKSVADPIQVVKNEKTLLEAANHPFVIKLFETFSDDKKIYFLTEALLGGELSTHIKGKHLSQDDAKFYIAAMILAFEHLHAKGIAHRDLKPENILLDQDGYPRLIDFGFAKKVNDGRTMSFKGTPEYLAPEIIKHTGHGKAADHWTLGVLLYELIEGAPPFWDERPLKIYERILKGNIVFYFAPQDSDLRDLIEKLLQVNPAKRLGAINGIADIKAHPWFAGFDWQRLQDKKLAAPFMPKLKSKADTSFFPERNVGNASPHFNSLPGRQAEWGDPNEWIMNEGLEVF